MAIDLTLRNVKGNPLTFNELDDNFSRLKQEFTDLAAANSTVPIGGVEAGDVAKTVSAIQTPEKSGDPFFQSVEYRKRLTDSGGTVIAWPDLNKVASDLYSCVISGGGQPTDENLIGYTENKNEIAGDNSTTIFTSSFDIASTSEVRVELVRADGVRLGVTYVAGILIERVGGKARITYPTAGHFVNDATGGAEGTNPALLTTQTLIIRSNVKVENLGSNCHLSGIYGGYDNVITKGIMSHIMGAHHRVIDGDHNSIWGGSYCTIKNGNYGFIAGGTNNQIDTFNASGSAIVGGSGNRVSGGASWIFGSSGSRVTGVASQVLGGNLNTVTGNGSTATGRENTATGNDILVGGYQNNMTGAYSFASGFGNSVAIYGASVGRGNTVAEGGFASGRQNQTQAIYGAVRGYRGIAYNAGEISTGYGLVADSADGLRNARKLALFVDTTDATLTYPAGISGVNAITIPADSCAMVRVKAVALRDNNSEARTFAGDFIVNRVGTTDPTVDGSASDVSVPASKTLSTSGSLLFLRGISGGLRARCQGEAGKNVRWLVEIELLQVIN